MYVIGLTGGIASGKSTIANEFAKYGVDIIDTDIIGKEIISNNKEVLELIISEFGREILSADNTLNRRALAKIVFENQDRRKALEKILHPRIRAQTLKQIHSSTSEYCIAVVPLLFETNFKPFVDRILTVDIKLETQLHRLCKRDNLTKEQAMQRINSQISREFRLENSDDIITTNQDLHDTKEEIKKLHNLYIKLANES